MRQRERSAVLAGLLLSVFLGGIARAQGAPADGSGPQQGGARAGERGGPFAGMARTMGEVTAVSGATLTLKAEDGSTVQVVTTENTRINKDQSPVKVSDLHPGDGLMAVGILDAPNKTLHAAMIFAQNAATIKAMRENLGKTYITGRITAVDLDNARVTVERTDHVSQTIGFDDGTSFKRPVHNPGAGGPGNAPNAEGGASGRGTGRGFGGGMTGAALGAGFDRAFSNGESITLADVKVGDMISGTGAVKGSLFVPNRVLDSPPRPHRPRDGEGAPPAGAGSVSAPAPGQR